MARLLPPVVLLPWLLAQTAPAFASIPPLSSLPSRSGPTIRVRLAEAIPSVAIHGFDLHFYQEPELARTLAGNFNRLSHWDFRCEPGKVHAYSEETHRRLELREPVAVRTPAGFLSALGRPYRDEILIHSAGSRCEVINQVDLEKYLDGLVNSEFSAKWNEESIAAQVVAARTYALYQIRQAREKHPNHHFDVDATDKDQVYDGSLKEDFRASRSVEKTRGQVLVASRESNEPLKAFYHSTCGGITELPQHVWGASFPGFKRAVRCPFCISSPRFHWEADVTESEIKRALLSWSWGKRSLAQLPRSKLLDLQIVKRDEEGRTTLIRSVWSYEGTTWTLNVSAAALRQWLGVGRIRSTAFEISRIHKFRESLAFGESTWHIAGRGNGHGVGMCQWGAKVMGERGYRTADILKFYYPDAVLRKLW